MNPSPQRGASGYGGGGSSAQGHHQQFPYVDPTEEPVAVGAVRAFFPAPDGGGELPSSSSSSMERARRPQQRWYGGAGGAEISLGHGHGHGHGMHPYHQFGVEAGKDGGGSSVPQLPRHSSSPLGLTSPRVVQEEQRSKKRKSPCVFKSPLSRMMLSPRVQLSPRMRLSPRVQLDKAFQDYSVKKSNRIFLTLHGCLREAMKIGGGNGYDIPHMKKGMLKRQGRLPLQLNCEASLVHDVMEQISE